MRAPRAKDDLEGGEENLKALLTQRRGQLVNERKVSNLCYDPSYCSMYLILC